MNREDSVCQYTILNEVGFEVKDLSADDRFKDKFYVKGDPNLKYYYGVPLKTKNGNRIGALCVLDQETHTLNDKEKDLLARIADEIVSRLFLIKENQILRQELSGLRETHKKVSHDIRGPISGIIGLAEIIEADEMQGVRTEGLLELISSIKHAGQSVIELADGIMKQKESKEIVTDRELTTASLRDKLEQLYGPQAKSKEIDLTIICAEESSFLVFPKAKLLQIIGNLLSNSLKFTPAGGTVTVDIFHSEEFGLRRLELRVSDSGEGMEKSKIEDIFSQKEISTSGTDGEKGFGFGLSVVRILVGKAKGSINVESEVDKGSSITISLPI